MKIMMLEADPNGQQLLSNMLSDLCELTYETSALGAIGSLGASQVDLALVDADCNEELCDWVDLVDFLETIGVDYAVFSSNGKVGFKNGQQIRSLSDVAKEVNKKIGVEKEHPEEVIN
jgi:hypothetical protein